MPYPEGASGTARAVATITLFAVSVSWLVYIPIFTVEAQGLRAMNDFSLLLTYNLLFPFLLVLLVPAMWIDYGSHAEDDAISGGSAYFAMLNSSKYAWSLGVWAFGTGTGWLVTSVSWWSFFRYAHGLEIYPHVDQRPSFDLSEVENLRYLSFADSSVVVCTANFVLTLYMLYVYALKSFLPIRASEVQQWSRRRNYVVEDVRTTLKRA